MVYQCKKHNRTCEHIDISSNSPQRMICSSCICENKISLSEIIDINEIFLFNSSSNPIFSATDAQLQVKTAISSIEIEIDKTENEIKSFFKEIEEKIKKIFLKFQFNFQELKQLAKNVNISLKEQQYVKLIQQILESQNPNIEEDLNQCIEKYYQDSSQDQIQKNLSEISKLKTNFSLDVANKIKNTILTLLDSLDPFGQSNSENCQQLQIPQQMPMIQENLNTTEIDNYGQNKINQLSFSFEVDMVIINYNLLKQIDMKQSKYFQSMKQQLFKKQTYNQLIESLIPVVNQNQPKPSYKQEMPSTVTSSTIRLWKLQQGQTLSTLHSEIKTAVNNTASFNYQLKLPIQFIQSKDENVTVEQLGLLDGTTLIVEIAKGEQWHFIVSDQDS